MLNQTPNLTGKTIVITGATSGIGFAAALELAGSHAHILGIGRSAERCEQARRDILAAHPAANVDFCLADLSSQRQVLALAAELREKIGPEGALDVLVNNAGMVTPWFTATEDGYETQFAVNHLAPFLLTLELLPLLQAAPLARVLTVSSRSHRGTRMHWDNLMLRRFYNPLLAYKQSKLANVLFTAEFNRRLGSQRLRAYAIDPGLVNTRIGLKNPSPLVRWIWELRRAGGQDPLKGAETVIHLASQPNLDDPLAVYWKDKKPLAPSRYALREAEAARLWEISLRLCGLDG